MEVRKTITSIFIAPTLQIDRAKLQRHGFINAFVKDVNRELEYEDCIFLLFKPENLAKFTDFLEDEYDRTKLIVEDYQYEDGYVVVVYKLDKKLEKDFDLVRQGKYSKTSQTFQALFPKTVKLNQLGNKKEETSLQFKVFNKTEDITEFWENKLGVVFDKDQEIWEGFDIEKEILDINKIKQLDESN